MSKDSPVAALERRGVNHVAFRVTSLDEAEHRLTTMGVALAQREAGRSGAWSNPAGTIGIPLQFVEVHDEPMFNEPAADAFIERVDHLGVACRSHLQARHIFVDQMGFPIECMQIDSEVLIPVETTSNDKYGAQTFTRPPIAAVGSGLIAIFVTVGDFDLEIIQPLGAAHLKAQLGTVPGTVGQDQGAISRFLDKRGEGLLHICFKTSDIREAMASVTAAGIRLIDPIARPGGRAGLISFMDRRDTEGLLMHFVERTPL
jgi:methylmalonyl-CoA/ethylmalonyl-CoA epimerase